MTARMAAMALAFDDCAEAQIEEAARKKEARMSDRLDFIAFTPNRKHLGSAGANICRTKSSP
jgi:hypothetical protein